MSTLDLAWAVRGVDSVLRSRFGIEEFSDDPDCIFRISRDRALRPRILSDGAAIRRGDPVLQVHLWNEHLPAMSRDGRSAAWANLFKRRMLCSFALLANRIENEERFR